MVFHCRRGSGKCSILENVAHVAVSAGIRSGCDVDEVFHDEKGTHVEVHVTGDIERFRESFSEVWMELCGEEFQESVAVSAGYSVSIHVFDKSRTCCKRNAKLIEHLVGQEFYPTSNPQLRSSACSGMSVSSEHKYQFVIEDGVIQLRSAEVWQVLASCEVQASLPQTVVGLIRSAMRGAFESGRQSALADVRLAIGVK